MHAPVERGYLPAIVAAIAVILAGAGPLRGQARIETFAGNGNPGFSGDGGPAASAALKRPVAVAVDGAGNVYIADEEDCRIRRVDGRTGIITTVAGDGRLAYNGDGGPATKASLGWPAGLAVDGSGNLFIADPDNDRIRRVDAQTGIITTVAGTGASGFGGDGYDAGSASLNYPKGVAVDGAGNLFIADTNNQRVRRVDGQTWTITTVAGNGTSGYSGDGVAATGANLSDPRNVAVDSTGNLLFIADARNHRIRQVDLRTGIITTLAGSSDYWYGGDGIPATTAHISSPAGVAVDGAGSVFIADTGNNRVRRVDTRTGIILLVAGTSNGGYGGDGGPATSASLSSPQGVAVDAAGNVYIADTWNARVRRVVSANQNRLALSLATLSFSVAGSQSVSLTSTGTPLNFNAAASTTSGGNWLSVTPASGATPATLNISVNPGPLAPGTYNGSVTVTSSGAANSPQSVAVSLVVAAVCGYSISPASQVFGAGGGTGSVGVIAGSGCTWAAGSNAAWLAITSGSSGLGSGTVGFSVAANTGPARTGSLTIAGQTFTVTQSGTSALFLVGPSPLVFSFKEGEIEPQDQLLSVYANSPELSFTASASGNGWLTVAPGSGKIPASLVVTVHPAGLPSGNQQGTITVTAPAAAPSVRTVAALVSIEAGGPAGLGVEPRRGLDFSFTQGAEAKKARLVVSNGGSGSLAFRAAATTSAGGGWLTVSPETGSATTSAPVSLEVTANPGGLAPGTYGGRITISSPSTSQSADVPVTITVSAISQTILLSQTGLAFTAVARGGAVPSQNFGVLNVGAGTMNWLATASTLAAPSGAEVNWLKVTPNRGSTDAASLEVPLVEVGVDPAGLEPGDYYGQVQVTAAGASNSPELVSVILSVLPPGSDPGPILRPTGLIFTAIAGAAAPGSQVVALSNLTATPRSFTSGRLTTDGKLWFTHLPTDGTVSPAQATRILVQPETAGLAPGVFRGVLTLLFTDGSVRNANVLLVLIPPSTAPRAAKGIGFAADGSCVPAKLYPLFTLLNDQFSVPAGWPASIEIRVIDDCGAPLTDGSVVASFSSNDPPLRLVSLKDGRWTGTWQSHATSAVQVRITVTAEASGTGIRGTAQLAGTLQANPNPPVIGQGGVPAIVAPGGILSILGDRLADGRAISSPLPLATQLGVVSVLFAGQALPLFFASDSQINAQVPFDITVNSRQQLIVRRSNSFTLPEGVTVAAAQPAVSSNEAGQALIYAGETLVDSSNPARQGDTIVIYCSGLGAVEPAVPAGVAAPLETLSTTANPVTVTIGGVDAPVQFAGLAPGQVALYQVKVAVPARVPSGTGVDVVITVAGQSSPPVTLSVQ